MKKLLLPLSEIFGPTAQGEGNEAGKKVGFVRLAGCDFRCSWCDSKFTHVIDKDTQKVTTEQLVTMIDNKFAGKTNDVVITGGNPALYNLEPTIDSLHTLGYRVHIETQGSKWPSWLSKVDNIIISPKGPSSQMNVKDYEISNTINDWLDKTNRARKILKTHNATKITIKIPVFDDLDYEFAKVLYELLDHKYIHRFYLSVGNNDVTPTADKASVIERVLTSYTWLLDKVLADDEFKDVYVLPQIHTLVWGNIMGV